MPRQPAGERVKLFGEAKALRSNHENDWRLASAHCLPAQYASWQQMDQPHTQPNHAAARRVAYDTTGARSLPKYVSILERLATPSGQKWHTLMPSDTSLRKKQRVRNYFDVLGDKMFRMRYHPQARFRTTSNEVYASMGVYGNGPMFLGQRRRSAISAQAGFSYIASPMRDTYFLVDDEGNLITVFRRFWLNVRQFRLKFPDDPMPTVMKSEANKPTPSENAYFEFVHDVTVRGLGDHDPQALDARRHPVVGSYICVKGDEYVGDETGYASIPYIIPRTATVSGDAYGNSPAVLALAALGGASAMKKTQLKQGNRAADPVLLGYDDGILNGDVDLRPGAYNPGGVNKEGRELLKVLPTGDFRIGEALLQSEQADIEDSFFVTLFRMLRDTPQATATEIIEEAAEKAALLSPTMGRLQGEFLGPTISREIDLMAEMGELPEMPPELKEAEGEYEVVYTSPMAKSLYSEEISGFARSVEMATNVANATQDPSALDHFNFDEAIPEISDYMAVPARWMNSEDQTAAVRDGRAKQAEEAQMMQNASGLAAAAKTAGEMGGAQ